MKRCPTCGRPLPERSDIEALKAQIYALNRRIRALIDRGPEDTDWLALKEQHRRLVDRYKRAGGREFF